MGLLVLDDGKVTAKGTHEELVRTDPVYRELVETQMGGGDFDGE